MTKTKTTDIHRHPQTCVVQSCSKLFKVVQSCSMHTQRKSPGAKRAWFDSSAGGHGWPSRPRIYWNINASHYIISISPLYNLYIISRYLVSAGLCSCLLFSMQTFNRSFFENRRHVTHMKNTMILYNKGLARHMVRIIWSVKIMQSKNRVPPKLRK